MTAPDTKKPLSLDDIAPYPTRLEDVTAEAMAKHFAAFTQLHFRVAMDHHDRDEAMESMKSVVSYYGITFLLRELEERAGSHQADEVARTLWEDWDAGSGLGGEIWEWLRDEYGVAPEKVNEIAADVIASSKPASSAALPLGEET